MAQATGEGGVPIAITGPSGATSSGTVADGGVSNVAIAHGVLMSLAFVLLLPMGVAFMRPLGKSRWHFYNQFIAVLVILVGWALGLRASSQLPMVSHHPQYSSVIAVPNIKQGARYDSYHQILGFVVIGLVLIQGTLGVTAHQIFKKTLSKNTVGMFHRGLGYGVILLGFITGFTYVFFIILYPSLFPFALSNNTRIQC